MIPFFMLTIPHAMQSNKYYWKSTHTAPHIVTGGSRAFRGINPAILKTELKLEGEALNIAFNGVRSPYGDYYNRLIRRKIETDKGNNLFILTVHPGLLSDYKEGKGCRECSFGMYDMFFVNIHPNPEYILRRIGTNKSPLLSLLAPEDISIDDGRATIKSTSEGWGVKVNKPNQKEKESIENIRPAKRTLLRSPKREVAFEKLVRDLAKQGDVILVRLPVDSAFKALEEKKAPFFSPFIKELSSKYKVPYIDCSDEGDRFTFIDGFHHLDSISAVKFSKHLAHQIQTEIYDSGE